jgi:pectin methylesterase-like acyl-CoA thioesterase
MKNRFLLFILFTAVAINSYSAPFRYIVATDGSGDYTSVQTAINACPDNERSIIFVKNGFYYGQISIGTKATASNKIISLIGENRDSVILSYDKSLPMVSTFELATTFQIYAKNFYAENISFVNSAGNTGQALALYTAGDMATFKNCTLKGYQDTYRAKKGTRGYFKNCWIEGAVDFIYAGGTVFIDDCTINCVKGGGYIVAPEDRYKYIPASSTTTGKDLNLEFILRNCNITANADVADNSYTLGRPWNINSGAYYINCKLGSHIKAVGWTTMGGNETTASFAEYNSMDKNGTPVSTSGRISWSFQLAKEDVDNFLNPAYVYAQLSTTPYDPVSICVSPTKPTLSLTNNVISWNALNDAIGYLIYKNGRYVGSTTSTTYTDATGTGTYSVKSINSIGVLSEAGTIPTALSDVRMTDLGIALNNKSITLNRSVEKMQLVTVTGNIIAQNTDESTLVFNDLSQGIFILMIYDKGLTFAQKLVLNVK